MRAVVRKLITAICALALAVVALPSASYATTQNEELRQWLLEHGVPDELTPIAIDKVAKGLPVEADDPTALPLIENTERDGNVTTITRIFSDGSFYTQQEFDLTPPTRNWGFEVLGSSPLQPNKVTGCVYHSGGNYASYWTSCRAEESNTYGYLFISFNCEYVRDIGPSISHYWGAGVRASGGSASSPRVERVSKLQILVSAEFRGYGDGGERTYGMYVIAQTNKAITRPYQ